MPATCDAVPRTPPDELDAGFASVFSAPSTLPAGAALALCVPLAAFDVLVVGPEPVFDVVDVVFELVLEVFVIVVDDDVLEVELLELLLLVDVLELLLLVDVFELLLLVDVLLVRVLRPDARRTAQKERECAETRKDVRVRL